MPFPFASARSHRVPAFSLACASLVASSAVGSIFLSTAQGAWTALTAAGPASPADGILLVVALVGACLSLWLGLGTTLSALSALPGELGWVCSQLADRVAPVAVRKVVAFVLGTTLTAALVPGNIAGLGRGPDRPAVVATAPDAVRAVGGRAHAAPNASFAQVSGPPYDREAAPPPAWSQEGPKSPARPARPAQPARPVSPAQPAQPAQKVLVHRGDTLWSIAARHLVRLGHRATAVDIKAECHAWLAANRDVIGDDANLIFPGQRLRPPSSPRAGA